MLHTQSFGTSFSPASGDGGVNTVQRLPLAHVSNMVYEVKRIPVVLVLRHQIDIPAKLPAGQLPVGNRRPLQKHTRSLREVHDEHQIAGQVGAIG